MGLELIVYIAVLAFVGRCGYAYGKIKYEVYADRLQSRLDAADAEQKLLTEAKEFLEDRNEMWVPYPHDDPRIPTKYNIHIRKGAAWIWIGELSTEQEDFDDELDRLMVTASRRAQKMNAVEAIAREGG